jgi:hypothetical protein
MYQVSKKRLSLSITAVLFSSIVYAGSDANQNSQQADTSASSITQRRIDNFNLDASKLPVVPSASTTGSNGEYKALTPLQLETDRNGGSMPEHYTGQTSGRLGEYIEPESVQQERVQARTQIEKDLAATPFKDAFKESFGGYSRDITRTPNSAEGSVDLDADYDVAKYRQGFRSIYPEEDWDELERTTSKSEYLELVRRSEEKIKLKAIAEKSPLGHILGRIFDPILIAIGLFLFWLLRRKKLSHDEVKS